MKSIVISIGGSVLLSKEADISFLKKLSHLLTTLSKSQKLFIIVGGGTVARQYIKLGRDLGFDEQTLDQIGIDITRVNAKILATMLAHSNKKIPQSTNEAKTSEYPIVVMGGTTPGHSTDMVGAELAQKTDADLFVIATNVNGIYDKDPNKHPDAKQLQTVHIDELISHHGTRWESAGKNTVIDGPALQLIKQSKLHTYVVNGTQLDQLENALTNQPFDGTKIIH